jgi:WD40 repeat protein
MLHRFFLLSVALGLVLAAAAADIPTQMWSFVAPQPAPIAYSPDGKYLAVPCGFGRVGLYQVDNQAPVRTFTCPAGDAIGVAFSPDGTLLASAASNGTVQIETVAEEKLVSTCTDVGEMPGSLAFSQDGTQLAIGGSACDARVCDVQSGAVLRVLATGHSAYSTTSVAWSTDGKYLVTGSDVSVRTWNAATGARVSTTVTDSSFTSLALAPKSNLVVVATQDGGAYICRAGDSSKARLLKYVSDSVTGLVFSPDGKQLAVITGWQGAPLTILRVPDGKTLVTSTDSTAMACAVAYAPDGKTLVVGGESLDFFNATTGKRESSLPFESISATDLAVSPDGSTLLLALSDAIELRKSEDGSLVRRTEFGQTSRNHYNYPMGMPMPMPMRRMAMNRWGDEYPPYGGYINNTPLCVAFAPDGKSYACGCQDGTVTQYGMADGAVLQTWSAHKDTVVHRLCFSHDGALLATAGVDGEARIWRVEGHTKLLSIEAHKGGVAAVAFSPDYTLLATAGWNDGSIKLYTVADGTLVRTINTGDAHVQALAFSPDGTLLASADGDIVDSEYRGRPTPGGMPASADGAAKGSESKDNNVRIWRVADGTAVQQLTGFPGAALAVAFSPDGKELTAGTYKGTVRAWSVADGAVTKEFICIAGAIMGVAYAPDGSRLFATGAEGLAMYALKQP